MNKTELINAISERASLSKADARAALDATLSAIVDAIAEKDKVSILGFGTFSVTEKGERTGVNPRTKETITIPARNIVKFKAGADFNEKIK